MSVRQDSHTLLWLITVWLLPGDKEEALSFFLGDNQDITVLDRLGETSVHKTDDVNLTNSTVFSQSCNFSKTFCKYKKRTARNDTCFELL